MVGWELFEAIFLGVVQGIAEFLPISSSGHLVILGSLFSRLTGHSLDAEHNLQLNVALHVGTLLSILVVYRWRVLNLWRQPRLCVCIVAATLPIVAVGLAFKDSIEAIFNTPIIAGACLLITAVLLLVGQKLERPSVALERLSFSSALVIGVFQAAAILPGVSRSGSTIAGGLLTGLRRDEAADFSFLIAIPAIAGAAALTLIDAARSPGESMPAAILVAGMLTSFVVGVFSLRLLLRLVSRRKLHWFAWYCIVVAALTIAWQGWEHWAAPL